MPNYVCLVCGHRWHSEGKPTRCGAMCGSYWITTEERYESIIKGLMDIVQGDAPLFDFFNAVVSVLKVNGITGRPLKTLQVAARLVQEAEQRQKATKNGRSA